MTLFLVYNFYSKACQKNAVDVSKRLAEEGHILTNQEIPEKDRQRPIWIKNRDLIENYYRAKLGIDIRSCKAADAVVVLWGKNRIKSGSTAIYGSSNLHNASFMMGLATGYQKPIFFVGKPMVRAHYHPGVVHVDQIDDLYWRLKSG